MRELATAITFSLVLTMNASVVHADLDKAKRTVDNIRQTDPPSTSTTTGRTADQAASEYRNSGSNPGPNTVRTNPVPSPIDRNNPRNDPDVQRGYDQHQKQHGK